MLVEEEVRGIELTRSTWGQEEIDAMHRVIATGIFTMGEKVAEFERQFAAKYGMRYGVMSNSGSSANLLGVAALFYKQMRKLQPGDEVIVPAISWSTTFYPLMQYGLKLRFVDVELETLNMDVSKLEQALTPRTKMIMAVSILGNPCALDVMRKFADAHGLYLFEDNCESMGAELNGKPCGTYGDINTFSTFYSHHISTMEGGMCLTDDRELADLMICLRAHGWTRHLPSDTQIYQKRDDDFFEAYRFILPGYNFRPTELNGAIGLEQLKKIDRFVAVRRKNGALFQELFGRDERFIIQRETGKSSWFSFTMILNPKLKIDRKKVLGTLAEHKIQFRIITGGNFLRHDVIKYCNHDTVGPIVNANIAHDRGFFIGNHPADLERELIHLREVLDRIA